MTGRIFISFRHKDSPGTARLLFERLKDIFGPDSLFIDFDLPAGVDFVKRLQSQLSECSVVLAVIGPHWLDDRRLQRADDWVRIEIVSALARGITVIPVIIDDVVAPTKSELPGNLRSLAKLQAFRVEIAHFDRDVLALADRLREIVTPDRVYASTAGAKQTMESIKQRIMPVLTGERRGWAAVWVILVVAAIVAGYVLGIGHIPAVPKLQAIQDATSTIMQPTNVDRFFGYLRRVKPPP
jgi:TIR domain